MHIFCDESGNTGTDLLNIEQPMIALASTCLESAHCKELIAPLLRQGQAEAKYSRLKGTAKGQQAILRFFSSPAIVASLAKAMVADKRYYLITHIVDKLIEPPLHEMGADLYAGDGHIALVNVWYYAGNTILPDGHWDRVLRASLRAMRERSAAAYQNFDRVILAAANAATPENRDFATGLLLARGRLSEFIGVFDRYLGHYPVFDPSVDLFINLINEWMVQHSGQLHVTHDRSKPLKLSESHLREMMTPVVPRKIGYGNRQAELPLRVSELDFGDSAALPQLQVADLIAGASVDCLLAWAGRRPASSFHASMRQTNLIEIIRGGMLPTRDIERENEPLPGQRNLVDGSTDFLDEIGFFNEKR